MQTLYRVDMEDATGTLFCAACADDAFECGLYDAQEDADEEECIV